MGEVLRGARFHLLPVVLVAPAVALGFDALFARAHLGERSGWVVVHVAFVAALVAAIPQVSAVHTRAYETSATNLLESLPEGAVLLDNGHAYFAFRYLQLARGVRPDVVILHWPSVRLPWARERLAAQGIDVVAGPQASVQVVAALLARGRAVFVDDLAANVLAALPSYPYGMVFRVLPPGTPRPPIADVFVDNKRLLERCDLDYPLPGPDDGFAATPHAVYAANWQIIGRALAAAGRRDAADEAFAIAHAIGPQP